MKEKSMQTKVGNGSWKKVHLRTCAEGKLTYMSLKILRLLCSSLTSTICLTKGRGMYAWYARKQFVST